MIAKYVAGFLFHRRSVMLVRKNRPPWQNKLMNGIGGTIEPDETPHEAMMREFQEETGFYSRLWDHFCTEEGPSYEVHFYRLTLPEHATVASPAFNDSGEELEWCDAESVKHPVIGNLNWLLPMAMDPRPIQCRVVTTGDIRKIMTW